MCGRRMPRRARAQLAAIKTLAALPLARGLRSWRETARERRILGVVLGRGSRAALRASFTKLHDAALARRAMVEDGARRLTVVENFAVRDTPPLPFLARPRPPSRARPSLITPEGGTAATSLRPSAPPDLTHPFPPTPGEARLACARPAGARTRPHARCPRPLPTSRDLARAEPVGGGGAAPRGGGAAVRPIAPPPRQSQSALRVLVVACDGARPGADHRARPPCRRLDRAARDWPGVPLVAGGGRGGGRGQPRRDEGGGPPELAPPRARVGQVARGDRRRLKLLREAPPLPPPLRRP